MKPAMRTIEIGITLARRLPIIGVSAIRFEAVII